MARPGLPEVRASASPPCRKSRQSGEGASCNPHLSENLRVKHSPNPFPARIIDCAVATQPRVAERTLGNHPPVTFYPERVAKTRPVLSQPSLAPRDNLFPLATGLS